MKRQSLLKTLLSLINAVLLWVKALGVELKETFDYLMSRSAYEELKTLKDKFEANGFLHCQKGSYSNCEDYCERYARELDYYDSRSASLALASIEFQVLHVVMEMETAFKSPTHLEWGELVRLNHRGNAVYEVLEALNEDFVEFLSEKGR